MKDYPSRHKNQSPIAAHPLQWLSQPAGRTSILQHAQRLMEIERAVHSSLPVPLRSGCRVLQLEHGVLSLGVPSGQFATRIKQLTTRLSEGLQQSQWPVQRIQIRVQPQQSTLPPIPYPKRAHRKTLSPAASSAFGALKKELPDGPLAQAVAQLLEKHSDR
ncbi:MAG TPA: DciA family protein [Paenalcaligenes sp.]|nr:DciA family protein [Paenalcaligenes sp.]